MQHDQFGYGLTLSSPDAVRVWDEMVTAFLAHGANTPDLLAQTLERAPDFAMAHAAKGLFYLMLGRRELFETAREALAAAQSARDTIGATERERAFVAALESWLEGRPSHAVAQMESVLATHPEDALAMKVSHAIRFILGDAVGMRRSIERVLPAYDPAHPARGYLLGCHAFALEETGDYARAETAGRLGLSLAPDDAWGLHAVAHVFDMTARSREGLDWLEGKEAAWAHCNNFRYHVWWHKALMHLDQDEIEEVFTLYDTEIRRDRTDDFRDISNGSALLMRLELEGFDVGDRWEEMAEICARRTDDGCLIFADLHYLLALIGGHRDAAADRLIARIRRDARTTPPTEMSQRMAAPGVAAATGLRAFGEGDFKTAFLNLAHARQTLQLAGGSHAQRDVFERLTIDAGLRAGFFEEAREILSARTARRDGRLDRFAEVRLTLIDGKGSGWSGAGRLPAE